MSDDGMKLYPASRKRRVRTSHVAFAEMIAYLLSVKQCSVAELAEYSGLHKLTVGHLLRAMRKAHAARITGYDTDARGRHNIPQWSLGAGKDAPRPPRADRNARRRTARAWKARQVLAEQLNLKAGIQDGSTPDQSTAVPESPVLA